MSKHEKYTRLKRQIGLCLAMGVALFSAAPMAFAATSVVANTTVPTGGHFVHGGNNTTGIVTNGTQVNVTQNQQNAVITWKDFSVGGSGVVNFDYTGKNNFNTLNYVTGNNISQIYGTINAVHDGYAGNIYIVNPSGVQIGNSAQINVGSLYVSNAKLGDDLLNSIDQTTDINQFMKDHQDLRTDAELMSLGNINATNVTFEGNGHIVIDTERIKDMEGKEKLGYQKIQITTNDKDNIVVGYKAYDEENKTYKDANIGGNGNEIATVNGNAFYKNDGYMWVEDVEQLQAINTNLGGNYALRNSIDATIVGNFNPIGLDEYGKVAVSIADGKNKYGFYGKFDGIDYNIFGLTIDRPNETNVGLFGVAHDAEIRNVTLVGGTITGGSVVGSVVGAAIGDTHISNATNSAAVTGGADVGGIVGYTGDEIDNVGEDGSTETVTTDATFDNLVNTGTITSTGAQDGNGGTVSNAGGLIGYMYNGTLSGNSYNLGNVSGDGYNVGGLVGHAVYSIIGNVAEEGQDVTVVYNRLGVTGAYNVGGIVGNMEGTTVQNAENSGTVTATGYTKEGYTYHTAYGNNPINTINGVYAANAGGIAGTTSAYADKQSGERRDSLIDGVINTGDVGSVKVEGQSYYQAGNVGGIAGKAVDTNIKNATNKENEIRGAHNVGGVAGYFGNSDDGGKQDYQITAGSNDGGDIMATGARNDTGFVLERVRKDYNESFIIGNIGGIAGYVDGDHVSIADSANRGTVHTSAPMNPENVQDFEKAANVGGIAGKIDTAKQYTVDAIQKGDTASVTNSYNTGDVLGYTGVGGVVGMMYNGAVTQSYNLGNIQTTRRLQSVGGNYIDPVNMGGVVGDTTEGTDARALLYDVYNKGQIGDETFTYFARHVGGIVGRLSGTVEKAYNTGDIYNNDTTVGGIAGWWHTGNIKNVFNTGNITVRANTELQVGGIVGASANAAGTGQLTLSYAYNLGTIRGYQDNWNKNANPSDTSIYVGGIIGRVRGGNNLTIDTVYTLGNLYAGRKAENGDTYSDAEKGLGAIYGNWSADSVPHLEYANYVKSESSNFADLSTTNAEVYAIEFANRYDGNQYQGFDFSTQNGGAVTGDKDWRIYDSTTPILNAFLPHMEGYFDQYEDNTTLNGAGIDSIQYGTAYDPLLTIVNANKNLEFDWGELGLSGGGSLAVYGGALTLDNVATGNSYYSGLLYSDGALTLNHAQGEDLRFSAAADLYGSSVIIDGSGSAVVINGDVVATGQEEPGKIDITAGEVDVYGTLTSVKEGEKLTIPGISDRAGSLTFENIENPYAVMPHIGDRFSYTTKEAAAGSGNITITAKADEANSMDGDVNLYFGNKGEGLIKAGNDLTVTADGDVFVDSDLDIAGNMSLTSKGKDGEVLLTLTNIGKVQADRITAVIERAVNGMEITQANKDALAEAIYQAASGVDTVFTEQDARNVAQMLIDGVATTGTTETFANLNEDIAVEYMHDFMHSFETNPTGPSNQINLNAASGDAKITVDMWVDNGDGTGQYDFKKYDSTEHTFEYELDKLEVYVNDKDKKAAKTVYVEVSTGEQLKGIQEYAKGDGTSLQYNYALMGDIDASRVEGYEAIGGTGTYNGVFDGRGNRVIGLQVDGDNAGLFSTVGTDGTVKDVNIYSAVVSGTITAGAVAGVNEGRIESVHTFGNTVQIGNTITNKGSAGGIVGINKGQGNFTPIEDAGDGAPIRLEGQGLFDVESTGIVNGGAFNTVIGGIVGTNNGALGYSFSDSAVTGAPTSQGFGGVVGYNTGDVWYVDSLGVTNGGTRGSSNVGGVIGKNDGDLNSAYNESIVSGYQYVGGIIGSNTSKVTSAVNAADVTGMDVGSQKSQYVGGLIGSNSGNVTNGRNNGEITGNEYVGGLVGSNEADSTLTNLVNDSSASITGEMYVGGIAGSNAGTITATNEDTEEGSDTLLINRGTITGQQYVGGVAGVNEDGGRIENTNNDVELFVKDSTKLAQYFGGVAGLNQNGATIGNATNTADVNAYGASYVGGVVGLNEGTLENMAGNTGNVTGKDFVGGVAGKNESAISGVIAENSGFVTATDGGAGGIFAVNTEDITNSWFSSKGEVSGKKDDDQNVYGTGGIFGVNEGAISGSVLENIGYTDEDGEYQDSLVTGDSNTGGLIGYNTGSVKESTLRNEANIEVNGEVQNIGGLIGYNEGQITGGRDAQNSYYKYQIYNTGTIKVTGNGTNIGGLFGTNSGEVTAAYNTGAIDASTSTNVGGIAGSNTSTLDQVFNTVIAGVDSETGSTLYGSIAGGENVGGLVGWNDAGTLRNAYNTTEVKGETTYGNAVGNNTGSISDIYATNSDGTLVGTPNTTIENSYSFSAEDDGITGITVLDVDAQKKGDSYQLFADFDKTWRIYDDYSNPLLKVFLTTLTIDADKVGDMTYNAEDQNLALGTLVGDAITAPNVAISKGENRNDTPKHDAFNGLDAYYSTINSEDPYYKGDSFLLGNTDDQVNAGDYANWLFSQQIAASNTKENAGTPVLGYDVVYTNTGSDTGLKNDVRTLDISLDDIYRTYGDVANIFSDPDRKQGTTYDQSYSIEGYDSWSQDLKDALGTIIVEKKGDNSLLSNDKTQNVGAYDWSATVTLSNTSGNFQLNDTGATSVELTGTGKAHVEKAELSFGAQDVTINLGDKPIYTASQEPNFVNGDAFTIDYGISDVNSSLESTVGTHEDIIGFWYNGQFYGGNSAELSNLFGGNYNVTFTPADLTVKEKVAPTYPDIPAWEFPGGRWDYLYSDAPFDRNRDFRERKAEINFVDGGMEL